MNSTTSPIKVQIMKNAGPIIRLLQRTVSARTHTGIYKIFAPEEHFHEVKVAKETAVHAAAQHDLVLQRACGANRGAAQKHGARACEIVCEINLQSCKLNQEVESTCT